jgi:predicted phosphodiesterase
MTNLQLAKELIEEKTGPDGCKLSKHKLAELLVSRYPANFKSKEAARTAIRTLTGSNGNHKRRERGIRTEWKGLSLPEPEAHDWSKLVVKESRLAILSDVHFPYYHKVGLNATIAHFRKWKPDCIILNGDIIDCYSLSRFEKDPRKRSFAYELDMLKSFFDQLKRLFPKSRIIFVQGNHEARYEKTILQRVPEFVDVELFNFDSVIQANKYGIDVLGGKRLIKAGDLNIGHGHEMPSGFAAPVNAARGFFMKGKANFLGGHHHATSTHTESDINDKITGAWSTGCLCELHPYYMPINKWNIGAATVEVSKSGMFEVNNFKIINGKVL